MFSFQSLGSVRLLSVGVLVCVSVPALAAASPGAQKAPEAPAGLAWQVQGTWQAEGKGAPIITGGAVQPGSLLRPSDGAANHSIIVLLPDGQRVLYECFTVQDCARGFRVPSLYRAPEPFAVDLLARIRAVLVGGDHDFSAGSNIHPPVGSPRDEVVAVLGSDNRVQVEGLAAKLPNGHFTYDLRPLDPAHPRQLHLSLEKTAPSITLAIPSSGLYVVTIADDLDAPRIHLFLAVVSPAQAASFKKSFHDAKELMQQWNENYYGWPIHDFQWAYLESLMLDAQPVNASKGAVMLAQGTRSEQATSGQSPTAEPHPPGVTAEPAFFPKAGLLAGDTEVTIRCDTQGAAIRYTVDTSQPTASSPVYSAPIVVKGTELTIKAFASVIGKKDSAVVTGIFRIHQ
jgi:Chitobiase/beta-hexosaminidase C-terminal domain